MRRRRIQVALVLIALAGGSCGGTSDRKGASEGQASKHVPDRAKGSQSARAADPSSKTVPGPRGPGSRRIVTPSGAVVLTAPTPRHARLAPARRCEMVGNKVIAPPRPGLTAKRTGRTVVVTVRFAGVSPSCRAVQLRVTLDRNADATPGVGRTRALRGPSMTLRLPEPAHFTPDVVSASGISRRGVPGSSATIRLPEK